MHADDALDRTFAALADPTRRAILARLSRGPASVGELAEPFDMSLPAVSRHIRVLTSAGLVRQRKDAQFRRCELASPGLKHAAQWLERYREFWERSFDALDAHLERKVRTRKKTNDDRRRSR